MRLRSFFPIRSKARRGISEGKSRRKIFSRPLVFEPLETRQMLSVTLGPINSISVPGGKTVLVPLTGLDSGGGPINYTFSCLDPAVHLSLVSPTSKSLQLNVAGTDSSNNPFTGTLVLHLFEDLAPNTTARIEQLVNEGYYNGLDIFRVLDGFVAQTGRSNNGNDTGVTLDDEFNAVLTYTSPGLLAMANRGRDTGDAELFITAIDTAGSTNPIPLSGMPQYLDFRYTIFGQLVGGFDTFEKIMSTTVTASSVIFGETSMPTNPITITSATIINDTQDAVLAVTAPASFDGNSAAITVTATNSANETAQRAFTASAVIDTQVDPPFLGPVPNHTAAIGSTSHLALHSTDLSGGGVTYFVVDPQTLGLPTAVVEQIDQQTGMVSFTGNPGFTGDVRLLAAVRAASANNNLANFDTQQFTLTLVAPTLSPVSSQTTASGAADQFILSSVNSLGNNVVYSVVDASTLAAPTSVDVNIDQSTGEVTLTPHAGFTGTVSLLARVIDVTSANDPANFVTRPFTLTVGPPLVRGDLNRDGERSAADVAALTSALTNLARYQSQRQLSDSDLCAIADVDHDKEVDNADVQGLICLLADDAAANVTGGDALAMAATAQADSIPSNAAGVTAEPLGGRQLSDAAAVCSGTGALILKSIAATQPLTLSGLVAASLAGVTNDPATENSVRSGSSPSLGHPSNPTVGIMGKTVPTTLDSWNGQFISALGESAIDASSRLFSQVRMLTSQSAVAPATSPTVSTSAHGRARAQSRTSGLLESQSFAELVLPQIDDPLLSRALDCLCGRNVESV
jgi:cyclophilin family peptidyl-prolyl cis-trans isomerase